VQCWKGSLSTNSSRISDYLCGSRLLVLISVSNFISYWLLFHLSFFFPFWCVNTPGFPISPKNTTNLISFVIKYCCCLVINFRLICSDYPWLVEGLCLDWSQIMRFSITIPFVTGTYTFLGKHQRLVDSLLFQRDSIRVSRRLLITKLFPCRFTHLHHCRHRPRLHRRPRCDVIVGFLNMFYSSKAPVIVESFQLLF